jgi:hypothetical protein
MVAIPYRFDPGHRHHENRFLYQEPVLFISVLILFCLCFTTKSIGDDLGLTVLSDERKRPSEPSEPAERKTNRLKRKDLRSTCVSKSQVIQLQKGYAVIVARAIMMIWTCVERFAGVPIDYGQAAHINIVP